MHYTRGQTFISVYRYRAEGNTPSPVVSREGFGGVWRGGLDSHMGSVQVEH